MHLEHEVGRTAATQRKHGLCKSPTRCLDRPVVVEPRVLKRGKGIRRQHLCPFVTAGVF